MKQPLQRVLVDLSVLHDQLEVVLVVQHDLDVLQRITFHDQQMA